LLIRSTGSDPNRPDVQVADFGLRDFTAWAVTKTSRGKAAYATPEELESQLTAASDQYALATVTYKILTGRTPFTDSPEQVINQIMGQQPPPPSTFNPRISPALDAVILRALAKRPWGRFASISEFATAFQRASSSKEVTRPPEVLYQPSSAPPPFAPANPYGSPGFLPSYPPVDPYPPPPPPLPVQGAQSGLSDVFKSVGNTVKKIFSGGRKQKTKETSPSLFAIARVGLEKDDRAAVGRQYTVQAGIAQNKPADFAGEPFTLPNWNPAEPVWFDILLHASDNIEVLREWHTRLRYDGRNPEPQLVTFWFRFITAGHGTLALNFYHERRWLKVIRFEVETIEQAESTTSSVGGWYGA
ncbi:MAG: hypothetical protein JOZ18_00400, partial [Chloroflexi bacterium]|nr:hypothetical protein [Chloroflexota bacterium]